MYQQEHGHNMPRLVGAGGSGVVIIKEPAFKTASSMWDLRQVYRQVKADDWV